MNVIKAIYNFIVGDMIILIGVLAIVIILALINGIAALAPLRAISGVLLIVAILGVLFATLNREAHGNK
jgi:hypothetical protein